MAIYGIYQQKCSDCNHIGSIQVCLWARARASKPHFAVISLINFVRSGSRPWARKIFIKLFLSILIHFYCRQQHQQPSHIRRARREKNGRTNGMGKRKQNDRRFFFDRKFYFRIYFFVIQFVHILATKACSKSILCVVDLVSYANISVYTKANATNSKKASEIRLGDAQYLLTHRLFWSLHSLTAWSDSSGQSMVAMRFEHAFNLMTKFRFTQSFAVFLFLSFLQ